MSESSTSYRSLTEDDLLASLDRLKELIETSEGDDMAVRLSNARSFVMSEEMRDKLEKAGALRLLNRPVRISPHIPKNIVLALPAIGPYLKLGESFEDRKDWAIIVIEE